MAAADRPLVVFVGERGTDEPDEAASRGRSLYSCWLTSLCAAHIRRDGHLARQPLPPDVAPPEGGTNPSPADAHTVMTTVDSAPAFDFVLAGAAPDAVVPEAPSALLLPLVGVAVMAGLVVARRRRTRRLA